MLLQIQINGLFLDYYDYSDWFRPPVEGVEKVLTMLLLQGDEKEVKRGKGTKLLTC